MRSARSPTCRRAAGIALSGRALYTQDSIERLREAVDMVELVGAKTDLRRVGSRWVGLCPFHEERTPSFSVDAEKKVYYCFGCEAGGDAIGFVREIEALDFPEAVELLADRYGVELRREVGGPPGGGAAAPPGAAARPARAHLALLRDLPVGVGGGLEGAGVPPRRAGWGRRCCASSASATRPARPTGWRCRPSATGSRRTS